MPRLPVGDKDQVEGPAIHVTWTGIILSVVGLLAWISALVGLTYWLNLDLNCLGAAGRRANLVEIIACSISAGPRGWFYLAVAATPAAGLAWALRKRLRSSRR